MHGRWLGLVALCLAVGLAGCGRQAEPDELPAPAPPAPRPPEAAPADEELEPVEPPVTAAPDETVVPTSGGAVAFGREAHSVRVERSGGASDTYLTAPVAAELSPDEQRALVERLVDELRYPDSRVLSVQGTAVENTRAEGNQIVAATFETRDTVADAADVYRERLARLGNRTYVVTTPLGGDQVVTFTNGMGPVRLRVVVRPGERGAIVETTQMRIAGAPTQDFDTGQGLLKTRAAEDEPEPEPEAQPVG